MLSETIDLYQHGYLISTKTVEQFMTSPQRLDRMVMAIAGYMIIRLEVVKKREFRQFPAAPAGYAKRKADNFWSHMQRTNPSKDGAEARARSQSVSRSGSPSPSTAATQANDDGSADHTANPTSPPSRVPRNRETAGGKQGVQRIGGFKETIDMRDEDKVMVIKEERRD